jgi:hypothetical protein
MAYFYSSINLRMDEGDLARDTARTSLILAQSNPSTAPSSL